SLTLLYASRLTSTQQDLHCLVSNFRVYFSIHWHLVHRKQAPRSHNADSTHSMLQGYHQSLLDEQNQRYISTIDEPPSKEHRFQIVELHVGMERYDLHELEI